MDHDASVASEPGSFFAAANALPHGDTVSRITDAVVADMEAWQSRPLDAVYAVVLIDAIVVKVRDTQVANRPVYVAIGVNLDGERDVLGLWMGPTGGEGAKQWMTMLTEFRTAASATCWEDTGAHPGATAPGPTTVPRAVSQPLQRRSSSP